MATIVQEVKKRGRKPAANKVDQGGKDKFAVSAAEVERKAYELYEKRGCQHGYCKQAFEG